MLKRIFTKNVLIGYVVLLVLQAMFHLSFMEMFYTGILVGFVAGHLDRRNEAEDERRKREKRS